MLAKVEPEKGLGGLEDKRPKVCTLFLFHHVRPSAIL